MPSESLVGMESLSPVMMPRPGERLQRFVGDTIGFVLKDRAGGRPPPGWRARLRTNLGRARLLRQEIIQAHTRSLPLAGASWRDLPMKTDGEGWSLELPLTEPGYFKAKAFLLDPRGWQLWPDGPDVGISVHPSAYRMANTVYCAFPRLFGESKSSAMVRNETIESRVSQIEQHGYTIIPPSGTLRDLVRCLPHIIETLGCRILHLLPVNSTPTVYARFGRFGSPYAALDLTAIDPALVVFDKRTNGVDQFRELTYAVHLRGARVLLDIVINHTGWGSALQEHHPQWFLRQADGAFTSPGAWGVTWEDLVELKHDNVRLWDKLAEMFLTWCRRGVDGFRCDAGYKVPVAAWQYIVARVQQEYPETLFLLEGLGGAWEATEALLTEGGLQWAYSELFQNYSGPQVAGYLDHSLKQSERVGRLLHYSETHDNERLAKRGRAWSLLRNRLCALTSVSGGFGFTCGAEWLSAEQIDVHNLTGLAWGAADNLVSELASLNRLLAEHPCFFDGAKLTRLSPIDSTVYALRRDSAEGKDHVLVLVNTDCEREHALQLSEPIFGGASSDSPSQCPAEKLVDLLGQPAPKVTRTSTGGVAFALSPGAGYCLSASGAPQGLSGAAYREARERAAWALQCFNEIESVQSIDIMPWRSLANEVEVAPADFLAALGALQEKGDVSSLAETIRRSKRREIYPKLVVWTMVDARRITIVPPDHWLLVRDSAPFRATLRSKEDRPPQNVAAIRVRDGYVACFAPRGARSNAGLRLERYADADQCVEGEIHFLAPEPGGLPFGSRLPPPDALILLTNGIGGMARICVDLGRVRSKYDCVLGANLHPDLPVDRHVFAKRIRVWVNADGFLSPLDLTNLASFQAGPPAVWKFIANAGDARTVEIELSAEMVEGCNTTVFQFRRPTAGQAAGVQLPADAEVRLTARVDIEDRNFHWETKRNGGAEHHFSAYTRELRSPEDGTPVGFAFIPAPDRQLRVFASAGQYHAQPEWSENIPHPVEQSRGQTGSGDAYSPGWFELPLPKGAELRLVVTAEKGEVQPSGWKLETEDHEDPFGRLLRRAARAFVVRRGGGKTVIAGYPWFLDWGRDTLIASRGLLAAGMADEVKQILVTFARFEQNGTLPNTIHGEDASNRDTSDAPLWFALTCEELTEMRPDEPGSGGSSHPGSGTRDPASFYETRVDDSGRTIRQVLFSIAEHYVRGTPNGIRMDPDSALIWSPTHFTWMDTNYPAGTPREGYPVEIQALWIRLLRQLTNLCGSTERERWSELAARAVTSLERLFWLETPGWYADLLIGGRGQSATQARASDALRSNCLFPVSLGLIKGERAKRCVEAAQRHLVVPGALRSLAPLPVTVPLPVYGNKGRLLNDPVRPYRGRYEGDEDTSRKPAYHNGTAWTWTFPVFCEALARAWDFAPAAVSAARAYLGSMGQLLNEGCLGQIPEVLDGDAPHAQRGCDAQAWGVTEASRVWKLLRS